MIFKNFSQTLFLLPMSVPSFRKIHCGSFFTVLHSYQSLFIGGDTGAYYGSIHIFARLFGRQK